MFTHLKPDELQDLTRRAMEMDPTYKPPHFGAFYYIDAPAETDFVALVQALLRWNSVQTAYVDQAGPIRWSTRQTTPALSTRAILILRRMGSTRSTRRPSSAATGRASASLT